MQHMKKDEGEEGEEGGREEDEEGEEGMVNPSLSPFQPMGSPFNF